MPKSDWIKNNIESLFKSKKLFPKGKIKSILDLGCGLSLKSQYMTHDFIVGVDIYSKYLEKVSTKKNVALIKHDLKKISNLFLPKSFDIVLILDVLEHLNKKDSFKLLKDAEKIAKKAVIIETPLGFIPQNIDIWKLGGDKYQTHRSSWKVSDFEKRGYKYFLRDYKMSNVKRHTKIKSDINVKLIDAIKIIKN